jgi:hypothetical protein
MIPELVCFGHEAGIERIRIDPADYAAFAVGAASIVIELELLQQRHLMSGFREPPCGHRSGRTCTYNKYVHGYRSRSTI